MTKKSKKILNLVEELNIPLLSGIVIGLILYNLIPESFTSFWNTELGVLLGHKVSLRFIVNEIFMALFFGLAAVEIRQAMLPGGDMFPIKKSINTIFATIGGVIGPIVVFLLIAPSQAINGWAIPTATDIAIAWLVASLVFPKGHPAITFILLLAVFDDAIGMGILAIFYPDPHHPFNPWGIAVLGLAIGLAIVFRKLQVSRLSMYMIVGVISWIGLLMAGLHPALALVPVFFIAPHRGEEEGHVFMLEASIEEEDRTPLPLIQFEHTYKSFITHGLGLFAIANCGIAINSVGSISWVVLFSLLLGKTIGITLFSSIAQAIGWKRDESILFKTLLQIGVICGIGLTVAIFVSNIALQDPILQAQAKMGALLSAPIAVIIVLIMKHIRVTVKRIK
jgi:Na+:H+ antiporter, NhaA family